MILPKIVPGFRVGGSEIDWAGSEMATCKPVGFVSTDAMDPSEVLVR